MANERQEKILKVRSAGRDSGNFGVTRLVLVWSLDSRRQDCHRGDHCRDNFIEREGAGFPWWLSSKDSACKAGDLGSILGLGRSPEEGKSYPLQYSCLKNSMDCIGVTKSWGHKKLDLQKWQFNGSHESVHWDSNE